MSGLDTTILAEIENMKRGVKAGIKRAMRTVLRKMKNWKNKHFAEDVGNLMLNTTIFGQHLKAPFQITMEIDETKIPYAKYVVEMKGVNWSNIHTTEDFFNVLKLLGQKWLLAELRKELKGLKHGKITVTVK